MNFVENNKPIYLQIADRICDDLMAGRVEPGGRIPSVREYAALVQVNANTVMRAYDYLSQKEVIYNQRGIGFFASADARSKIEALRAETFYRDEIEYFFSRLASMRVSPGKLAELYSEYLSK